MINVTDYIKAKFTAISQDKNPEKWIELRRTGIGGSDAGAIMGMNKYASPLTVYMQKKGISGFEGNAATKWGHILEDPIRQETARELDIEICTVPGMYTSIEYDWMNANLDGLCHASHQVTIGGRTVEGVGGHEIKTSANGDGFGDDEIPDSYYCQVQHYMAVTGLPWFILTAFFLNNKNARHYIITRNDDFISDLIEKEKDFWENNVLADIIPSPLGLDSETEYLRNLPINSTIQLDDYTKNLIAEELEIDAKIKDLQKIQQKLKNSIILSLAKLSDGIEKADKVLATSDRFMVTYNMQLRKSIDTESLKKAGLYDKYSKETASKVMRISEVK